MRQLRDVRHRRDASNAGIRLLLIIVHLRFKVGEFLIGEVLRLLQRLLIARRARLGF